MAHWAQVMDKERKTWCMNYCLAGMACTTKTEDCNGRRQGTAHGRDECERRAFAGPHSKYDDGIACHGGMCEDYMWTCNSGLLRLHVVTACGRMG